MGMLKPTLNERSDPVGKIMDRFFRDFGIFDSSTLRSSEVAFPMREARLRAASGLLADFIWRADEGPKKWLSTMLSTKIPDDFLLAFAKFDSIVDGGFMLIDVQELLKQN